MTDLKRYIIDVPLNDQIEMVAHLKWAGVLVPDDTLQQIADAYRMCPHGFLVAHHVTLEMTYKTGESQLTQTCNGAPELRVLLDGLNDG